MKSNLTTADGRGVVCLEERVDAGVDEVWAAITDPARLAVWLGDFDGDLRLGGEYHARYHASGWEGDVRIEACEPPNRVFVRAPGGTTEVTLTADGDGTLVTWEERGNPVELLAAYGAGIQIHVEDLAAYVAGRDIDHSQAGARWETLNASYEQIVATRV
jgi:uncharacterized protein YndB with AHSA1/START domain